ncbi:MAG: cation diffusion facilitator family transporter [Rhabdaerophilum sp.]
MAASKSSLSLDFASRLAIGSILVGLVVLALKFGAYWHTGSVALYSDALESTINVVAACVALLALQISAKPADARHPYGHQKVEYLAAVFEGALILVAALMVFHSAWEAWKNPRPIGAEPLGFALNIAAGLVNGFWCWILLSRGKMLRSPALIADGKHLLSDVVSSLGVLAALVISIATGLPWLDPVLAALVGINILVSGWKLMQSSFGGLMDEAAAPEELEQIRKLIATHGDGAIEAHDLRTRHSGRTTFIEFHLVVPGEMRVDQSHDICDRIEAGLRKEFSGALITIHVEPENKAKHTGIVVL